MFAEFILGLFIPAAITTFFVMRPLSAALLVSLGGELFLPEGPFFHIPFLPILDKHNLPYLCVFIGCLLRCPGKVTKLPKEKWIVLLALIAIAGGVGTGLTNAEPAPCGDHGTQAMTFKDGMSVGVSLFFQSCLTFYTGYALVRDTESLEQVLVGFGIAGLVYSPFAVFEMRMSPKLHGMFYGIGAGGAIDQAIRWGGYRPSVFLPHGLAVARFFMATTLALFVLAKFRRSLFGLPIQFLAWFQAIILVFCRSTGAIILGLLGIILVQVVKPKRQLLIASVLALVTLFYPLLRAAGLFPVAEMLNAAGSIQAEREGSLAFRFANEDILLAHAREKPLFGWGTYGRNLVCDESGRNMSITDGWWIIVLGSAGMAGFIVTFINLLYPVLVARRRLRNFTTRASKHTIAGAALILVLLTVDLIPNALWCYYPYFLAGALTRPLRKQLTEHEQVESIGA